MGLKPAPLNTSFLITAIIGLVISFFYITQYSVSWAFAFGILFFVMLIASFISMREAPVRTQFDKKRRPKKVK
jgi:membrane protein CcdC involved in cytochrome C biogenesis